MTGDVAPSPKSDGFQAVSLLPGQSGDGASRGVHGPCRHITSSHPHSTATPSGSITRRAKESPITTRPLRISILASWLIFLTFPSVMNFPVPLIAILAAVAPAAHAVTFYTPVSITSSTSSSDLFSANNLIQGPGIGYSAAEPHDALGPGGDPGYSWVTSAPGGFPSDYIAVAGRPILVLDLGATLPLSEIST